MFTSLMEEKSKEHILSIYNFFNSLIPKFQATFLFIKKIYTKNFYN